jgi:hypothetical protein
VCRATNALDQKTFSRVICFPHVGYWTCMTTSARPIVTIWLLLGCSGSLAASPMSVDAELADGGALAADSGGGDGAPSRDDARATRPSDAGPLAPVANCTSLPAAGTFQEVTPPDFRVAPNVETFAVVVDPTTQYVYTAASNRTALTDGQPLYGSGLYRSQDCGATWEYVNTGRGSEVLRTGMAWSLMLAPHVGAEPTIYVSNGYGSDMRLYRSTNGGVDFDALDAAPPGTTTDYGGAEFVHATSMAVYDSRHIAVAFHTNCSAPHNGLCFSRSLDGGDTWQILEGPRELGGWGEGASLTILGPSRYLYSSTGFYYTDNDGQTWSEVSGKSSYCCYPGNGAWSGDEFFAPAGGGEAGVWRTPASDPGAAWTPIPGSPDNASSMTVTRSHLLLGRDNFTSEPHFWMAPLNDLGSWTRVPYDTSRGPNQMAYDPVNNLVYAANFGAGLHRLVAP